MTMIELNITEFRQMFTPQFDDVTKWPDIKISMAWNEVSCYMSLEKNGCGRLTGGCREIAAYTLLAHLLMMDDLANAKKKAGRRVNSATEGSVTVSYEVANGNNPFWAFLGDSDYGRKFLSLLSAKAAGGLFVSGRSRPRPGL